MTKDICCHFNPLSLYRERQEQNIDTRIADNISIHSPYTGRDKAVDRMYKHNDISIHSPYTGRDCNSRTKRFVKYISIHSPYTGRDRRHLKKGRKYQYFNPLSLYRERQRTELHSLCLNVKFQSTLPIQGETKMVRDGIITVIISIHSPYTGRDVVTHVQRFVANISIHSPYTGRDPLRLPG